MGVSPIGSFPFIKKVIKTTSMIMGERVILKFSSQNKQICGGHCGDVYFMAPETYSVPILFSTKIGPMFQKLALFESNLPLKFPRAKIIMNHPESSMDHHDMRCKKRPMPFTNGTGVLAPLLPKISSMRPSFVNGSPEGMTCERWQGETQGMLGHMKRKHEIWYNKKHKGMQIVMMD